MGSGGGSVGRAVAYDTRDPRFQIPKLAKFYLPIVRLNKKDKNKEKEAGNGPSFKAFRNKTADMGWTEFFPCDIYRIYVCN